VLHAGLVAEDGAARDGAGRIDRQHRHTQPFYQVQAQGFDEGGFADARHAADAKAKRLARVRQQSGEQAVGLFTVVGPGGFKQGNGLGHGPALHGRVAAQDAVLHLLRSRCDRLLSMLAGRSETVGLLDLLQHILGAGRNGVPGPYTPLTPAL
jgi:hypothetical protein